MVDKSIFNEFEINEAEIEEQVDAALSTTGQDQMLEMIDKTVSKLKPGVILTGTIVNHIGDDVIIEVGLKSEGAISSSEFDDPSEIQIGDKVELLLEAVESDSGLVQLSKRKADRIRGWERIIETNKEGDTVKGRVIRRIKGGLLVDMGVPVFLPASQVDIRRPGDISEFIGREVEAVILKIDEERRNIVISRRKMLEQSRASAKSKLLEEIEVGQIRKGVVKNIADFGAFVDLGGLDGLLHITDMSWGRVNHPSEIVRLDQDIEIKILSIDREREKIALGLKQKTESPWITAEERYKVNSVVRGEVVNITNYGAFIKLEEGVEGLVHISQMSWTKRINHPGELLNVKDTVDVVVLEVNAAKQEISLGTKQLTENPWMQVVNKYPPGTIAEGTIRNLANYGAFIEIEEGIDGLLHVSDMSWTKKINHPGEMLKKGQPIKCIVLSVNQEKQRVALGLKQMTEDPWLHAIPDKYIPGQIVQGTVTKLTNFGVFIELEPDLEGLLHVSELSDDKVAGPQEVVKMGQDIEVKILRVDYEDRKIGLSLKRAQWATEDAEEDATAKSTQRGGLDGAAGMGTNLIDTSIFHRNNETPESSEKQADETETKASEDKATEAEATTIEAATVEIAEVEATTVEAATEETSEAIEETEEAKPATDTEEESKE
ncbi:MAG: 30S ribosomal protein S1 [Sedimentisphaerales bacterium]|nr:30S ribosomal protein S1 [Sedimentisphaerales bacterium]